MSTSDSIVSSQTKQSSWRKSDTTWTLGLFGTAIGAGVLFFPIRAGFGGLIDSSDVGIGIPHRILLPPGAGASMSFWL